MRKMREINNVLIVSGGTVDEVLLKHFLDSGKFDYVIGVDKGNESLEKVGSNADYSIGDFDSISKEKRDEYISKENVMVLNPMKDYTDTHVAVDYAINAGARKLTLLGATGSRIDHMLGNIDILINTLKAGIKTYIIDNCNRIQLIDKECSIRKDEQYGKYVSIMPYTDIVNGISLKGFVYDLEAASIIKGDTIGISNEIREEEGFISIEEGLLLVLETKD